MDFPTLSVVIPAYNRLGPLSETLLSVQAAAAVTANETEIILVDDGSATPLSEQIGNVSGPAVLRHVRQANLGPIAARLAGLRAAHGEFVLFLDSDDLVHPEKFSAATTLLRREEADIVYDDMARATRNGSTWTFEPAEALRGAKDSADFFLKIQPAPHSPIYRRNYLHSHLEKPLFKAQRIFDAAGDVWLYYNLSVFPARIVKLDRALTAIGPHEENRFSLHWERLAVSSLAIMEAFASAIPPVGDLLDVRIAAGECAFDSWRRLPRDFDPRFSRRMLSLWRAAPHGTLDRLGGPLFQRLARVLGPANAGRILRLRNASYRSVRTASSSEVAAWLAQLP